MCVRMSRVVNNSMNNHFFSFLLAIHTVPKLISVHVLVAVVVVVVFVKLWNSHVNFNKFAYNSFSFVCIRNSSRISKIHSTPRPKWMKPTILLFVQVLSNNIRFEMEMYMCFDVGSADVSVQRCWYYCVQYTKHTHTAAGEEYIWLNDLERKIVPKKYSCSRESFVQIGRW